MKHFDHEDLHVYKKTLVFLTWLEPILIPLPKSMAIRDQLDRASTSIPLNIAEGNGKYTAPDRCRFFDNARGSALECAASFDVLLIKNKITSEQVNDGKEILVEIVSMLIGLIKANSSYRLHEGGE